MWAELVKQEGRWSPNTGLGAQQWRRALKEDPNLIVAYKNVGKSYSAQRKFKAQWTEGKYDEAKTLKTKNDTLQRSDTIGGKYKTFDKLVVDLGNTQAALEGARRYLLSCVQLTRSGKSQVPGQPGKTWLKVEPMSQMPMIWHIEEAGETVNMTTQSITTTYPPSSSTTPPTPQAAPVGATEQAPAAAIAKGEGKRSAKGQAKGQAPAKTATLGTPAVPKGAKGGEANPDGKDPPKPDDDVKDFKLCLCLNLNYVYTYICLCINYVVVLCSFFVICYMLLALFVIKV